MTPLISLIVPVRDDAVRLARCVQSILANEYPREAIEVLVGDNGSTDDSAQVAAALGAKVLSLPGHRVSQVRNLAAAQARGTILAFIDADHVIAPGWAAHAAQALTQEGVGAVGAPYHGPPDPTWVQQTVARFREHEPPVREGHWLGSGNLAVHRDAFQAIGGFDATLETCEDVDFCLRLRKAGYRLLIDERLHSVHFGDPRTLKALFFGELWRGRDNLRVTFRHGLTPRDVPSVVMPIGVLVLTTTTIVGAILGSPTLVVASLAGLAAIVALRTLLLTRRARTFSLSDLAANVAVAAAYEAARALALVMRVTHKTRRDRPQPQAEVTAAAPPPADR